MRPGVITELNDDDGDRRATVLTPVTYDFNGSVNYLPLDEQRVDFVVGVGYCF